MGRTGLQCNWRLEVSPKGSLHSFYYLLRFDNMGASWTRICYRLSLTVPWPRIITDRRLGCCVVWNQQWICEVWLLDQCAKIRFVLCHLKRSSWIRQLAHLHEDEEITNNNLRRPGYPPSHAHALFILMNAVTMHQITLHRLPWHNRG